MEYYWLIENNATSELFRYWPHRTEASRVAALVGFTVLHSYPADGPLPEKYWALKRHILPGE